VAVSQASSFPTATASKTLSIYLNLFAQQHHHNLTIVGTSAKSVDRPNSDGCVIASAAWNGTYGYTIELVIGRDDSKNIRLYKQYSKAGISEIGVVISTATNPDMLAPTNERPILQCPNYPYDRMTTVLKPFGLKPFSVPENWADYPYRPDASPNTDRKTPPNT
jgi:hypothetical protein